MSSTIRNTARKAFTASIPVMAGYVVLGIAFGILLSDKGYSILWALAMSVFIYAGSICCHGPTRCRNFWPAPAWPWFMCGNAIRSYRY